MLRTGEAIDAAMRHDLPQLLSLLATTPGPCVSNPPEPHALLPPVCPGGSPDGTLVPALVWGSPLEIVFIAPSQTEPFQQFTAQTFTDHLIGVGGGANLPAAFIRAQTTTIEWLEGPEWSD